MRRWFRRSPPILNSLEAYAQWAHNYPPHAHNALMQAEEAAMRDLLPELQHKCVLDLACGTGRYGLLAETAGAHLTIGFDNSPAMLQAHPSKRIALATTEAIPLARRSVDVVLCGLALGHLPQLEVSMREIGRVLRPNGFALVSDFHPFMFFNGGQRTFTAADGLTYAVEHYPHLYADYHRAARMAGLQIVDVIEAEIAAAPGNVPAIIAYKFCPQV